MASNIDLAKLRVFVQAVRNSLPAIRTGVASFLSDATRRRALEDAYEALLRIQDAARMIELADLSRMLAHVQALLEEVAAGPHPLNPARGTWLDRIVDQIDLYLEDLLAHDGREQARVAEVEQAVHQFQEIPALAPLSAAAAPPAPAPAVAEVLTEALAPDAASELIEGFFTEAEDHLNAIGRDLPTLEDHPEQRDVLQSVRRGLHTLKGAAGVVGFQAMAQLAHRMEDVLDQLYDGRIRVTPRVKALLMATFDALDEFVRNRATQGDLEQTAQALYRTYDAVLADMPLDTIPVPAALPVAAAPPLLPPPQPAPSPTTRRTGRPAAEVVRVPLERLDELVRLVGELVISRSVYEQHFGHLARQVEELRLSVERLRRTSTTIEAHDQVSALVHGTTELVSQGVEQDASSWSASHEVQPLGLERSNEWTLATRALTETTTDLSALGQGFHDMLGDFDGYLTRQRRLTGEIQDKLMQLRMVPLATLATRLHRTVRVTAHQQGKEAALHLEGEEVTLDKTVLEAMTDPLLHLLRNAVDHGIEPPELRQTLGKPRCGQLQLRAFREGTQMVIQVSDDGAGLDPQVLRTAALRGEVVSSAEAVRMTTEQLQALIFLPGFSTAREVNEVSGRGVGMDVVQTTVGHLKGRVTVASTPGQGTTFTIRLPLTLAIARVLLVKAHGETFALPLADVMHVMRLAPETIEYLGDLPILRVEGRVVPVIRLGERLQLQQPAGASPPLWPVVVTQAGDQRVALVVDQLLGGREVVVKTLGNHLRHVDGVIGSTLMGDGSVVLILNPSELVHDEPRHVTPRPALPQSRSSRADDQFDVLIVDDSFSVRRVVSNLIRNAGWHPMPAKDGVEALTMIQRAAKLPDVILMDIDMPQMDGYELTSTLRAHALYRHIPIIMLTSRAGEQHRQKAAEVGATAYLVKPYNDATLLSTIRRLASPAGGTRAV